MARPRGARPSPRHRLAAAHPHRIVGQAPEQFIRIPEKLSMWLNDVDGDCVTAEEAFAKDCNQPEIFIADDTVKSWAEANGVLNGAILIDVLDRMETAGFQQNGKTYNDGSPLSVDWTNEAVLQNAIAQGPVKIGVAADQLDNAVTDASGWIARGFTLDEAEDHCVSLCGYGKAWWLLTQLGKPPDPDQNYPAYALFTWNTIGVIDVPSLLAITQEAWLRNPTTVIA